MGEAEPVMATFGGVLRAFRRRAGLTQEELAERAALSVRTVRNLEADRTGTPRLSSLRALADALGLHGEERARFDTIAGVGAEGSEAEAIVRSTGAPVPFPLGRLVGREDEVAKLAETVVAAGKRLVTLTGLAGIGKTRLALAAAEAAARRGRRTWWVPLSGLPDSKYVLDAIAAAVGAREVTAEAIGTRLHGEPALLVVDNLEHLYGAGEVLVELLHQLADVSALVTSRAPIGHPDEQEWPVRPLAVPTGDETGLRVLASVPSIDLLVERIRSVAPTFELTPDVAPVLAELCIRLDGLPLALELAAGQWRVLGAAGVLDAISTAPLDVRDLRGTRPAAHASLRSALGASYRLLSEETRHAFGCLSVFRGGWTVETATQVVADEAVPEHLDRLTALGLVHAVDDDTGRRFSMLPTILAFASDHARDAMVAETAAARHARCFRGLVADLQKELADVDAAAYNRVQSERDNIRAALAWFTEHDATAGLDLAGDLYRFWLFRGQLKEGIAWFERLLARVGHTGLQVTARLHAANLAFYGGQGSLARRWAEHSLEDGRRRGDAECIALALGTLGEIHQQESLQDAVRYNREAAATFASIGESFYGCWALVNLAITLAQVGRPGEARPVAQRALALAREHEHRYRIAEGALTLADNLRLQGELRDAERCLTEHEPLVTTCPGEPGDVEADVAALWCAMRAVVAAALGELHRARGLVSVALTKGREVGRGDGLAEALWAAGEVGLAGGNPDPESWREALACLRRYGVPLRRVEILAGLVLTVDAVDTAALAVAAVIAIQEQQGLVVPPGIATRLDQAQRRWVSTVGDDRWTRLVSEGGGRPHDEIIAELCRDSPPTIRGRGPAT